MDSIVKQIIDVQINVFMKSGCPSRAEAARVILSWHPLWYWQTPEGQYLEQIAAGGTRPLPDGPTTVFQTKMGEKGNPR